MCVLLCCRGVCVVVVLVCCVVVCYVCGRLLCCVWCCLCAGVWLVCARILFVGCGVEVGFALCWLWWFVLV